MNGNGWQLPPVRRRDAGRRQADSTLPLLDGRWIAITCFSACAMNCNALQGTKVVG